jgi:hypothetical protein
VLRGETGDVRTEGNDDTLVVQVQEVSKEEKMGATEASPTYLHEQTTRWLREACTELDAWRHISTRGFDDDDGGEGRNGGRLN